MATGILLRITDTRTGECWERRFGRFPVRIGRSPISNLRLDHSFVSQYHAVLELHGTSLMLRDLGSTNGTLLHDEGRAPPNQLIDLGAGKRNHSFSIASLHIQAFPIYVDQTSCDRPAGPANTHHMPAAGPSGATESRCVDPLAQSDAALEADYQAYRAAWATLHRRFLHELNSVEPPLRARFIHAVARSRPQMAAEPDFLRAAGESNVTVGSSASQETLQRVRELAARYLPSQRVTDAATGAAFLSKVRETLDVFFECFVPLRDGYREFQSSMVADRTRREQDGGDCVQEAKSPQELAACMLDWTRNAQSSSAVAATFADVMIHHVAMLNGVMMGVNCLLNELSPATIMRSCEKRMGKGLLGRGPSHKVLWSSFVERFSDLADEQNETFRLVFGPDFAASYRRFQKDGVHASNQPPTPSLPERMRMAQGDEHSSAFVPAAPKPGGS